MGMAEFSPSDTIIGMKNPAALRGGESNITINNHFNIDASVDKAALIKIFDEFARKQGRELRAKISYVGGIYA